MAIALNFMPLIQNEFLDFTACRPNKMFDELHRGCRSYDIPLIFLVSSLLISKVKGSITTP